MFALLRRFIEFVRQLNKDPEKDSVNSLFLTAIWSEGDYIDTLTDILGWINDNLEKLLENGVTDVYAIRGNAFAEFIVNSQRRHKYVEFTNRGIEKLRNGVILVAMDTQGHFIEDQLILSKEGLSPEAIKQFRGEPMMKINITN